MSNYPVNTSAQWTEMSAPRARTVQLTRLLMSFVSSVGLVACGMEKFGGPPGRAREICQGYVDGAAPFIGQQQGFGVTFAVATVLALGLGAAIGNAENGNFWDKNRKAVLLTSAGAFAILCYNFLDNAKSAANSAAQASIALASTNRDEMWAGCQRAHAVYFDGRAAGISATRDAIAKDTTQTAAASSTNAATPASEPPSASASARPAGQPIQ